MRLNNPVLLRYTLVCLLFLPAHGIASERDGTVKCQIEYINGKTSTSPCFYSITNPLPYSVEIKDYDYDSWQKIYLRDFEKIEFLPLNREEYEWINVVTREHPPTSTRKVTANLRDGRVYKSIYLAFGNLWRVDKKGTANELLLGPNVKRITFTNCNE